jgi:tetratricopeptide (TPR) repeat protein
LRLARICRLAPDALTSFDTIIRKLQRAVADTPRSCKYRHWLGAILSRVGKVPDAIRLLNEAIKLHQQTGLVADWLFLAMAHHRLGQPVQARKWLDKANAEIGRMAKQKANDQPFGWVELLELRLLQREAEALLGERIQQPSGKQARK